MPRFNSKRQVTPQIGFFWHGDQFITQDCSTPCPTPLTCKSSNGCHVRLSNGDIVAHHATALLLGEENGVWAYVEFIPGQEPTQAKYHDSFGRNGTNSFPIAIGPERNIAVKPHSNVGTVVMEPDGFTWALPDNALNVQLLSGKRAIWTEGGVVASNFPITGGGLAVWSARAASDGVILCQRQSDGALVLGGKVIAPPSPNYFYPDVILIGGTYHITWSPNQADTNAQFKNITRAELAALPAEPVVIPPDNPPTEDPEDPLPVFESIRLPDAAQTIVVTLYNKHKALAHGDDDQRRELTSKIAETVRYKLGPEWGWKKASGPPSKDTIAKREGDFLHGFDLFNGATREPNDRPNSMNITGQTFIEVPPINHLGSVVEPPPPPPVDNELEERVLLLEKRINELQQTFGTFVHTTGQAVMMLTEQAGAIAEAVQELQNKPQPRFRAKGKTGRAGFQRHDFDVEVIADK
jgi:hypothetical protein